NGSLPIAKDGVHMEIQSTGMNYTTQTPVRNPSKASKQADDTAQTNPQDSYVRGNQQDKVTYNKPKVDHATIARLKEESDQAYQSLKSLVEELLRSQGKTFQDFLAGHTDPIEVDETTRLQAQAA